MTPRETVLLTRYVKACCPQQAIDEYTADAWHDLLGDLRLDDCRAAVAAVGQRQPFIAPAEIRAEVARIRADRLANADTVIPAADPDDPAAYIAALRSNYRDLADGRPPRRAITGRAEVDPAGQAAVREVLADFEARRQAAANRRAAELTDRRAYIAALTALTELPDFGQALIVEAEQYFGADRARLDKAQGISDREKVVILAAQLAAESQS